MGVNAIGKHWVKKRSIREEDFAFHIINNMAQKNNAVKKMTVDTLAVSDTKNSQP